MSFRKRWEREAQRRHDYRRAWEKSDSNWWWVAAAVALVALVLAFKTLN